MISATLPPLTPVHRDLLPARLERWAVDRPDRRALIFLGDGETESGSFTFAELHAAARRLAGALRPLGVVGRPVLLLSRSGLDFAAAFFGCLYAGAIAVPCSSGPRNRGWERIAAIAADAEPAAALVSGEMADLLEAVAALRIPALRMDHVAEAGPESAVPAALGAPALLQYTSGSTGSPKGVIVTHDNLAANLRMLESSFGVSEDSVYLTWLPLFHDMGLIGNFLTAVHCGVSCILVSPLSFYQKPQRWLAAISRYGATISGGPNFAYELCVRRFARMDLAGIDLSGWELAFCGAELVRPATMRRFADLFARAGFRASALYPCYGLAEATVFVTGVERNGGAKTAVSDTGVEAVSCGRTGPGGRVMIVDPETATPLPDGRVGEVWVTGDHVAKGYWKKPVLSEAVFAAQPHACGPSFLRTGDLGWMRDGELYPVGRLKDLMVCRGANVYPEDIEATAAHCHPGFGDVNAAFSVEVGNEEQVVLVQELARPLPRDFDPAAALIALSEAVANVHGLRLHDAILVRAGSVPRTTSGKVQRRLCGELYSDGTLEAGMTASLRSFSRTREPAVPSPASRRPAPI